MFCGISLGFPWNGLWEMNTKLYHHMPRSQFTIKWTLFVFEQIFLTQLHRLLFHSVVWKNDQKFVDCNITQDYYCSTFHKWIFFFWVTSHENDAYDLCRTTFRNGTICNGCELRFTDFMFSITNLATSLLSTNLWFFHSFLNCGVKSIHEVG